MTKGVLDTDILSEINKAIDQIVAQNASDYLDFYPQLTFTSVSVYEVIYGLRLRNATRQLREFLSKIVEHDEVVPTTEDYRLAAAIRADMQLAGTTIGSIDPIIAACALNRDLPLITGNTRHHNYIRDAGYALQLINWREANGN